MQQSIDAIANTFTLLGLSLGLVESCTGGALSAALVAVPGASRYFKGGIVAYSDAIKMRSVYVRESTLQTDGAVSEACVKEMANGGLVALDVDVCMAVSGIAGPEGGTPAKPVGTVWLGLAIRHKAIEAKVFQFEGQRYEVQQQVIEAALAWLASLTWPTPKAATHKTTGKKAT